MHQIKAIAFAAEELFELILADALKFRDLNAFVEEISVFIVSKNSLGTDTSIIRSHIRTLSERNKRN